MRSWILHALRAVILGVVAYVEVTASDGQQVYAPAVPGLVVTHGERIAGRCELRGLSTMIIGDEPAHVRVIFDDACVLRVRDVQIGKLP